MREFIAVFIAAAGTAQIFSTCALIRVHDGPKPSQLKKFTLKTDVHDQNVVWTSNAEIASFREVLSKFSMCANIIVQGGLISVCPRITIRACRRRLATSDGSNYSSHLSLGDKRRCGRYIVRSVWRGDAYK